MQICMLKVMHINAKSALARMETSGTHFLVKKHTV